MTPSARQVYGETKVPRKFCPFCGHKNDGHAERCEGCGKDISWMVVPEQSVYPEAPPDKIRSLPKSREPFSRRKVMIIVTVILAIAVGIIIAVVLSTRSHGAALLAPPGLMLGAAWLPPFIEERLLHGYF